MKKAELSTQTIILMILVLVVIVVLVVILTSQTNIFKKNVMSCESRGGECVPKNACSAVPGFYSCPDKENPECCIEGVGG